MFKYGYYVLAECMLEHKVCVEDNNEVETEKKSNCLLSFVFSKVEALGIEFCLGKICNFKSASR